MTKPIIYAIVVTYNGAKWVDKCFGSLMESNIPVNVLAIDNASTDKTVELIKSKYPSVELIETGANLGFGKANNIGLKRILYENADYAFLLNQDAWIEPDTIKTLIEVHRLHPEFGILSPLPYAGVGNELDYIYNNYYKSTVDFENTYHNNTYSIDFINAAGWLMSKDIVKEIGGFHYKFHLHGEDKNYIDRIHFHSKYKIGVCTQVRYFHDRQLREKSENLISKRIYALKSSIKTQMYNPAINPLSFLGKSLLFRIKCLAQKKDSNKINILAIIYSVKYFYESLFCRQIYFKP